MNILVTGSEGFIGKNLIQRLKFMEGITVFSYDIGSREEDLKEYAAKADIVYQLAGINRPQNEEEFMEGNRDFVKTVLDALEGSGNTKATVVVSSSIQAELDNPYGRSKKAGEELVRRFADEHGGRAVIYRFPNVFGKWCRPNYNSVVATFCHNIARSLPIKVNDPETILNLVYIDDVVDELVSCMDKGEHVRDGYGYVPAVYTKRLGDIADLIDSFAKTRQDFSLPDFSDGFEKKLYSTYLSYLCEDELSYPLVMHEDHRGSFTEFLKTDDRGQVSVNISHPGVVKGNHWHNTKNEKFLVIKGEGLIRLRKVGTDTVSEYRVSGEKLEVVDIPCGYTHSIENVGNDDMATVMWVNEIYDPEHGDTFHEEV